MVGEPIRERVRSLERHELAGLVVLAVLILAGAAFWYVRSLPRPVELRVGAADVGDGSSSGPAVAPSPSPSPVALVVHIAGWVVRPGVYQLRQGDRVIDAVERAGGPKPGADLRNINLAAPLVDGQQVVIAKEAGRRVSGTLDGGGGGSGAGGTETIDLNTATQEQLETLPGVGEVLAQRIVQYREEHGPFGSVDDLLNVSGIGDSRLADIRPLVRV